MLVKVFKIINGEMRLNPLDLFQFPTNMTTHNSYRGSVGKDVVKGWLIIQTKVQYTCTFAQSDL